ncbi:MAG: PUR family DNA/RNA-binding protein [Paludibacteraceae bacterium]|nr:PUR family DNA/RNA-binding protein [Paludibacteraceae bacterium]
MENRSFDDKKEPEIVYSHSVKAGKRIYYLDVKKARNEDLYLCITESKKKQGLEDETPQFEKHKVFLYREDFDHFKEALQDVVAFIEDKLGKVEARPEWTPEAKEEAAAETATAEDEESSEEPKKKGLFGRFKKA